VRHSAGTATVDLIRHPLPPVGRLDVSIGAGRLVLVLPDAPPVQVDARVVTGDVTVDGERADDGIDVRWCWSSPVCAGPAHDEGRP
jgi:hypothetical protein